MPRKLSKYSKLLIILLSVTALLRFIRLDYPKNFVFDEVYHAFTAREYLKGSKEAWDPYATPPKGVAYEWTHPPLAKEVMTVSMFITHSTEAWAFRLPGALMGILSVYLIYLLGLRLLNSQTAALIAAFVFSIDGLNFVQSRTGMNDIYFFTFALASLLFFLKRKYLFSFIFLGLSFASKWAAVYLLIVYLILLIKDKKFIHIIYCISIVLILYLASYIPYFLLGYSPNQFIGLQQQMWWYHTNLKAAHDYSSAWWSWPLNLYPVWYFVDYQKGNIANIFASGNPLLFWVGIVAMLLTVVETIKKRSFNLFLTVLLFLVFWLPWSISPRIMFLYHYSPSVPFLALSLGYQLNKGLENKQTRKLVFLCLFLLFFSFVLIFPFLTGIFLPREFVNLFFATNLTKNPF